MIIHDEYELENNRGVSVFSICPNCKSDKTYQRFVSSRNNMSLANDVGECPATKGCGYRYLPFHYSKENGIALTDKRARPSFIPHDIFSKSLKHFQGNNLFLYLSKCFGPDAATKAMKNYSIGTSKNINGSTVIWNIDREDKPRTGRITLFDEETGKETKVEYGKRYVHQLLNIERFNAVKCLFGENLLKKEPGKPVIVVYSEKTAIIASCIYPEYLWLSMPDGIENPDNSMLRATAGRMVDWFPSSGFEKLMEFEPQFFMSSMDICFSSQAKM